MTCTATDRCTNRSVCTFTVTVRPSLLYNGLCHWPLGLAALNVNSNDELELSGLGPTGEDGVRIDLGESQGLRWQMRSPADQITGDLDIQVLGRNAAGEEVQVSRMMHHYENGKLTVTPSFASYEVKLLLKGEIVYRRPGTSGFNPVSFCTPVQDAHCVELIVPDFIYISGCNAFVTIECTSETESGPVVADTMVITPEVPGPQVTGISAVQMLGRNLPIVTLHRERLLMFGSGDQPPRPHRALGQARFVAENGTLLLADLGSSGEDGVAIDLRSPGDSGAQASSGDDGLADGYMDEDQPPYVIDPGNEFEITARTPIRATCQDSALGSLILSTLSATSAEVNLRLRACENWLPPTVMVLNGGQPIGGAVLPGSGPLATVEQIGSERLRLIGSAKLPSHPLGFKLRFNGAAVFALRDGTRLTGNEIRVLADTATPGVFDLTSLELTSRGLSAFKITAEVPLKKLRLACPPSLVVRICSTNPIPVSFPPPVVTGGACSPPPTVVCVPPSGSTFSPGTTTVQCVVTNVCGERAACSFTVTVIADATAPVLTCPTNQTVWICSPGGAVVNFPAPLVVDNEDPNPTVTCVPPSGSVFPAGTTAVVCTATDSCTNRASCTFSVTVNRDTNAPAIQCPTNQTVFTCTNFAVVQYLVSATDNADPNVIVVCAPPSGSKFPIGVTTVVCTATDRCGNTARCTFDVTVRIPRLGFTSAPEGFILTWPEGCALEEAIRVNGPWHLMEEARSPFHVDPVNRQRFYRLAVPDIYCPSVETNPRLTDVLSRMYYASVHGSEEFQEYEDVSPEPSTNSHPPRVPIYDPRPGDGYSWNSAVGRRFLLDIGDVGEDREGAASHTPGSVEQQIAEGVESPYCVNPSFYVQAGDRVFSGWSDQTFQAPMNAFATKPEAEAFLLKVHAEQPFFLPFSHPDVKLGHGWYYNDGGLHRACDYSRSGVEENEDPTFLVKSAGSGIVVATDWDGNGGNYVAVEHTAPGGQKVMFIYLHLRNGRSHDVAKAKSSTSADAKYVKYRAFANNYPNHLSWGTESHTIKVKVGDPVGVGTEIAWAGNTGAGGAGSGLNDDGSPKDWRGNVHLHVYVAVPHPSVQDTWVWVDPYGVYQEVDTGCYDLLKDTKFSRLYAPFYPTFHGVPYEVFKYYWGYYPDMGMKLRTLSIHRDGNSLLASGSFQTGISGGWYLHTYRTVEEFQDLATAHYAQGYIMRETTVEKTVGGQPRYSAIWRPLEPGEAIEHRAQLTDAQWSALWQDRVVEDEWRLEDYFGYSVGGVNYHSVFVTSHEGRPFLFSGLMTSVDLDQTIDEYKSDGFLPVSFNAANRVSGLRFSGIFRDLPGCWKVRWGLTPSEYQSYVSQQVQLGYRVWKVQGYADSNRYGVVLYDPTGPCQ